MSSFRDKLARALDWMQEERIRRTAGVPRGGQGWSMDRVICKDRALLKAATVSNKGGTAFWLFVCDSPTQCDSPTCAPLFVPPSTAQSLDWTAAPRLMSQGIYVCASTDPAVRTLIASADAWFEVAYEPIR